jgi:hypothetical protein
MNRKTTPKKNLYFTIIVLTIFFALNSFAQITLRHQGFDSSPDDTWGYTTVLNTGTASLNSTVSPFYVSAPNSYRIGGSNTTPSGSNDPYVDFNNTSIVGYNNIKVNIAFTSNGSVDDNDDLYLEISYDNGTTYPTSIKLFDGKASGSSDNLEFIHAPIGGTSLGSLYTYNVPGGNTQIKVRVRFDELNNQNNTSDYYFIDNISLTGVPVGNYISLFGQNVNIPHNSLANITNGTSFGSIQIVSDQLIRTFTIKNIGSNNINLTGAPLVSLSGSSDFQVTTFPSTPIASEAETTFQIRFLPSSIGLKTATVSIESNDSDENPFLFEITGTGIQKFFDSDGDGIFDNIDIDDDNDGIIDTLEESNCVASMGNSVNYKYLHETFGTGARTTINTTYNATTTYCYEDGSVGINTLDCPNQSSIELNDGKYTVGQEAQTIASWAPSYWYTGGDHTGDPNGRMAMFNASYTPGIFYTATITGAIPNIPIQYNFWVINLDRTDAPGIATRLRPNVRVEFRDSSNNLLTFINTGDIPPTSVANPTGDWYNFSANLVLNVSTFNVIFINNNTGGLGNDLALDDILITQTLCDRDNDGIADLFDLDSDNDGIPDVVEVNLGNLSNGKGKIDVAWLDLNANGLHDGAESMIGTLDSDGDGIPNYIDLDSDNDSIFDVDESGATNINAPIGYNNGDGDIDGDGRGDGPETEAFRNKDTNGDDILEGFGDGILDIYDYNFNIYGNLNQGLNSAPFINYVLDTDGDGTPDYLDITSNGVSFDILNTLYASLDGDNDGIIDGSTDIDKDGILDNFDTDTAYFGSPRNLERKLFLELDGRNDYAQDSNVINGWSNATLMGWININSLFSSEGIVFGQDKIQVSIDNSLRLTAKANGTTINHPTPLNTAQWIHVGVVYDNSNSLLKLYLNGQMVNSTAISGNLTADASLLTIGKDPLTNTKYFKGKVDEVRIFNIALNDSQYQKMVYQEIMDNASQIRGEIIPKNIPSLPWNNLIRYYRMDNYKHDVIDDHTTIAIDNGSGAKIYNVKNIKVQEAPMPFITEQTGSFAIASNSASKQIRGLDAEECTWSIVHAKHNIVSTNNTSNLGLIVDSGVLIEIQNDSKLQNDWYLNLNGKIDLQGRSQLVQTTESDLEVTSAGLIERDQQGTTNKFNYNYWSSPVGPVNTVTNNNDYTLNTVFKDGTNPVSPVNINWIGGYDSTVGTPINLCRYWTFKFQNVTNDYANWTQVLETGTLAPAQGYTLKGSNAVTLDQNYTFIGKPFNGTITNPIAANNLNLSGNPYASALDASKFITDNASSLTGTLYFWEHYTTNSTHNLAEYQGGYATRNLTGGVPPVAPALVSGLGSSTRVPGRFIPVGQGFFVSANATGGTIEFNNSQRAFVKEDDVNSNEMFRNNMVVSNQNDSYEEIEYEKIRLGFTSNNNYHRQVLLGFMNNKATNEIDYGYDGLLFDEQSNDMFFTNSNLKLIIQGEGYFNENNIYPLTVTATTTGTVKFMLDGTENFNPSQPIYIHNSETNYYHDLRDGIYEVSLTAGTHSSTFSLRFKQETLSNEEIEIENGVNIIFTQNNNTLSIKNNLSDTTIQKIHLFNLLGQNIETWDVSDEIQQNISVSMDHFDIGTYIVKTVTTNGDYSKKIIKN